MPGPSSVTVARENDLDIAQFTSLLDDTHNVLDGDLRLRAKGDRMVLDKVNWGCSVRRKFNGDAKAQALPAESQAVRKALFRAIVSSNSFSAADQQQIIELSRNLLGINRAVTVDELNDLKGVSGTALSRLTARNFIEKYTRVQMSDLVRGKANTQSEYFMKVNDKGEVLARRLGGVNGLMLKKDQFDKLFTRAADLAAKDTPAEKAALDGLVARYQSIFADKNASIEELQRFFHNDDDFVNNNEAGKSHLDLDLKSVAEKMKSIIANEVPLVEKQGKTGRGAVALGIFQDKDFKAQYDAYVSRMSTYGDVDDMIEFAPVNGQQNAADDDKAPVRNLVADLFFNEDPVEMETCGISDGERIARVLFSHLKVVKSICREVAQNSENEDSNLHYASKMLENISPQLAADFKALIQKINGILKQDASANLTTSKFLNNAQNIIKAVETVGFERKIDTALKAFFEKKATNGQGSEVFEQVCKGLCLDKAPETDNINLLKMVMQSSFELPEGKEKNSEVNYLAHRRMLAAGARFSMVKPGQGFDYGAMLLGAGPSLLKRLQTFSKDCLGKDANIPGNMDTALYMITHKLQGSGKVILKAQLYSILKTLNQNQQNGQKYDKIVVSNPNLGAASIAQAISCTLVKNGPPKKTEEVVAKVLRPEVTMEFEAEFKGLEKKLSQDTGKDEDKSLKSATRNFISSVRPELDFENETVNAMLAMFEQAELADRFSAGKGAAAGSEDVKLADYKSSADLYKDLGRILGREQDKVRKYNTEELLLKDPEVLTDPDKRKDVVNAIKACYNKYTDDPVNLRKGLKEIAKGLFVTVSSNCIIMKKAKGVAMDAFLKELEGKLKDHGAEVLQEATKAKKAMLQLGQELFNGLAYGKPPIYHGDLHGGNIFYDPQNGTYTLIDHGKGFPLTKSEANSILECFALASEPYDDDESSAAGVDAILEQYKLALKAELKAVTGDPHMDAKTKDGRLSFLRTTIGVLEAKENSENGETLGEIKEAVAGALSRDKDNPGNRMVNIAQAFKNCGLAVPDTLFGFFDSYAKLDKSLAALDSLISKAGQKDEDKNVTLFDKNFSFGENEENYKNLGNNADEEVMGKYYAGLPAFIRKEADEQTRLMVQKDNEKAVSDKMALDERLYNEEGEGIDGGEDHKKSFNAEHWGGHFEYLAPNSQDVSRLESLRRNMQGEEGYTESSLPGKLKSVQDRIKNVKSNLDEYYPDEIRRIKAEIGDKTVEDDVSDLRDDLRRTETEQKEEQANLNALQQREEELKAEIDKAQKDIEELESSEGIQIFKAIDELKKTGSMPLYIFLWDLNNHARDGLALVWNSGFNGDTSGNVLSHFAADLKALVLGIGEKNGLSKDDVDNPENGIDQNQLVSDFCAKYRLGDAAHDDEFKDMVSNLVKREAIRVRHEKRADVEDAYKRKYRVDENKYQTDIKKSLSVDEAKKLENLKLRCKFAQQEVNKLKKGIQSDFGSLGGLFLMSVTNYMKNRDQRGEEVKIVA